MSEHPLDVLRERRADAKAYSVYGHEGKWLVDDDTWVELHASIDAALRAVEQLEQAARPLAESWDFHAMDYLADLVDGEEQRVMPASYVSELIEQQKAIRAALALFDRKEQT